jgi:16S rRNA G966 N2-methylase RsmD
MSAADLNAFEPVLMDWQEYCKPENWHEKTNLVPMAGKDELEAITADIATKGLQNPVVLFEGKVLDGRNRLLACAKRAVQPRFTHFHPNGISAEDFVYSQNLHRRQLSIDQRAALAAQLVPTFAEDAKKRQIEAGREHGIEGGRGKSKPLPQKCGRGLTAAAQAAKFIGGVSDRYVEKVLSLDKKAREKSEAGVLEKIKCGNLTIRQAEKSVDALFHPCPLHEAFVAPPFSVLDARQGYWRKRKDEWARLLGAKNGHSEQLNTSQPDMSAGSFADNSVFDPVLAEFVYRSFSPLGGKVLDPFAGESTKGLVAAKLGLGYTGIELRQEQVEENRRHAESLGLAPTWIQADSAMLSATIPATEAFDLVFTSPPYYDLEIYSKDRKDGSSFESYDAFIAWYADIFQQATARLKNNRFLVVKVGEIRDKKTGFYRNFVGDTISCFMRLGLKYYNEAVLVTAAGTAPMRAGQSFPQFRKLVKTHQNLLCFYKGDNAKLIPDELGVLKRGSEQ